VGSAAQFHEVAAAHPTWIRPGNFQLNFKKAPRIPLQMQSRAPVARRSYGGILSKTLDLRSDRCREPSP
jgi:hypothetical protein